MREGKTIEKKVSLIWNLSIDNSKIESKTYLRFENDSLIAQ